MKYNVRNIKSETTDSIKTYIESKLNKLDKYFENSEELLANFLISKQGVGHKVEVTIPLKKMLIRAEETNKDLYASIDLVTDKLERQIRKNKTRIKRRENKEKINMFKDFEAVEEENSEIIKRKTIDLKPMSEEEAILQMNLLGHEFFAFQNADTKTNSVLYKRKDGNYGIIDMK